MDACPPKLFSQSMYLCEKSSGKPQKIRTFVRESCDLTRVLTANKSGIAPQKNEQSIDSTGLFRNVFDQRFDGESDKESTKKLRKITGF